MIEELQCVRSKANCVDGSLDTFEYMRVPNNQEIMDKINEMIEAINDINKRIQWTGYNV